MPAICRAYETEEDARAAVAALQAAVPPGTTIRVLTGMPAGDAGDAPAGEFAGAAGADAPVGGFSGSPHEHRDGMGGFAGGAGHMRQGGYADADRDTVATYADGAEHVAIASHATLRRILLAAGLDERTADADVAAVHDGRVLVLVEAPDAAALRAAIASSA
jgi:hypothetical protein